MWTYSLNHLERYATTMFSSQDAAARESPHALFTAQMQTLGRRIGQMHCVLAGADPGDPAFATEPLKQRGSVALVQRHSFRRRRRAARAARAHADARRAASARRAGPARSTREPLFARIRELCSGPVAGLKMRHHGNLHLGKVLLVADDFLITGFEGNASLPLEERRMQGLAAARRRDGAAVVRLRACDRAGSRRHGRPDLRDPLEPALDEWLRQTTRVLPQGYRRAAVESSCVPADDATFAALTALFQIECALHELRRELEQPAVVDRSRRSARC